MMLSMSSAPSQKMRIKLDGIFNALRDGCLISDCEFDDLFTAETRRLSLMHWTPVQVAVYAAKMLAQGPDARVLDVGCGPGKFCLIGAATQSAHFAGIDQRPHLLKEGEIIALGANIGNIEFISGNMVDLDWSAYNAFYLYNPFLENAYSPSIIDKTVPLKLEFYYKYIETVRQKLTDLPLGTRVVTYFGFGGDMPYGYRLVTSRAIGSDFLMCWVKENDKLEERIKT
jgi:SAM-dependent methyltransferase